MPTKTLGQYIVSDPTICHGEPTFRGTRILVSDVQEPTASGMVRDAIIEEWHGALERDTIAESVRMAPGVWEAYTREGTNMSAVNSSFTGG
jgi:uncharacterized protein (DUF433 family)